MQGSGDRRDAYQNHGGIPKNRSACRIEVTHQNEAAGDVTPVRRVPGRSADCDTVAGTFRIPGYLLFTMRLMRRMNAWMFRLLGRGQ